MFNLRDIMFILCLIVLILPITALGGYGLYQMVKTVAATGNPVAIAGLIWALAFGYFFYYINTERVD